MKQKICHFTSIHSPTDVRIFLKEACSLATYGYETHLVAPGIPNKTNLNALTSNANNNTKAKKTDADLYHFQDSEAISPELFLEKGVNLHNVQQSASGRLGRMSKTVWAVYQEARQIKADLYHFHDPELIPIGILLKLQGKYVIRDVHENLPEQILSKHWIRPWLRRIVAFASHIVEVISANIFDGIVVVTPAIARRFPLHKTILVQNFPRSAEFAVIDPMAYSNRPNWITYVGGITEIRGIKEMVQAIALASEASEAKLVLAGSFRSITLQKETEQLSGWEQTNFLGWQSRDDVANLLAQTRVGLVLYHPVPNHIEAQPNKLFEYMAAGIPVIASDFPLWREIVEQAKCGLLVDPLNPQAIAEAIQWLLEHPQDAEAMGQRGQQAVLSQYNWDSEAKKLIEFYEHILQ